MVLKYYRMMHKNVVGITPISEIPWIKVNRSVEWIKNRITMPGIVEVQWKTKGGKINSIKHRVFK